MSVYVSANVWLVEFRTASAKLVALCMADSADEKGKCWPTNRTIAARCQLSIETVKAAVAQLEEDGWIRREPFFRRNGSQGASTTRFDLDKLDRHGRKAKSELLEASRDDRREADEEMDSFGCEVDKPTRMEGEQIPRGAGNQTPTPRQSNPPGGGGIKTHLEPSRNRQGTVIEEPLPPSGGVGAGNARESVEARFDRPSAPTDSPTPKSQPCAKRGGKGQALAQVLARERNPAWDALAEIEGHGGNPSPIAAGGIGRALKAIRGMMPGAELEAVAAEIRRRAGNWASHFEGATITAMALAKWWARMEAPKAKAAKAGGWETHVKQRDAGLQGDWSQQFAESAEGQNGKTV